MKHFGLFIILFCVSYLDACKDIKLFNQSQIEVIAYAYHYGKDHNLGYTMAAIAWKESCAGLYRINFDDPSAGIYHAYLPGVIKRHYKAKNTSFRRNIVAERLIRDQEFASKIALEELLYWRQIRRNNWKEMIKSYNKGFSWEKSKGRDKLAEAYYEDIAQKVKVLEKYFAQNPILQYKPKSFSKQNTLKEVKLLNE
ncbi:hypothetical protein [Helicobacter pametensis]|uniref:hypothetical protein n=1 Tax=Helicobacter pametensis TaxID=95149 RepID=UPI0004B29AC2|nr:hypothetical protein [Helicobacter pametensis]